MTKITLSNAKKIAMKFFGSEMTHPPHTFGNFPEIHPFRYARASLRSIMKRISSADVGINAMGPYMAFIGKYILAMVLIDVPRCAR